MDYISSFTRDSGYAPSLEEIKKHFNLSSRATIHQHIESLIKKGMLKKTKNKKRTVAVTRSKMDFFSKETLNYLDQTKIAYRKKLGQYFTPRPLIESLFKELPANKTNLKILDPACGTGEFLKLAKCHFPDPELYGWEIDEKLAKIAGHLVPKAKISIADSLTKESSDTFDLVIGNPPYYEFKPAKEIVQKYYDVINGRANIYGLFIKKGLQCLKKGGYLAFVVPPSMNNGAYFNRLRQYIVSQASIEYMHIPTDPNLFHGALQSVMLIVLKKGYRSNKYVFRKNGIVIFSENTAALAHEFKNKTTLHDLRYNVLTGRLVWNQNKKLLTNNKKGTVPLIWAHNISENGLKFPIISNDKPQYVNINHHDAGPAIVTNRITGTVKGAKIKAAIIPAGMKFIAENHINVIFPPSPFQQGRMDFGQKKHPEKNLSLNDIADQLTADKASQILTSITGNTQISKNELLKLFPFSCTENIA